MWEAAQTWIAISKTGPTMSNTDQVPHTWWHCITARRQAWHGECHVQSIHRCTRFHFHLFQGTFNAFQTTSAL